MERDEKILIAAESVVNSINYLYHIMEEEDMSINFDIRIDKYVIRLGDINGVSDIKNAEIENLSYITNIISENK